MSVRSLLTIYLTGLTFLLSLQTADAQDMFYSQPGNVFSLSLTPELGHTDNFFYDASDEQSTSYLALLTQVNLQLEQNRQLFALHSQFHHWQYQKFSQDNHSNYRFTPSYRFKLTDNKTFFIKGHYQSRYELRGTGLSLGNGQSLVVGDDKVYSSFDTGFLYGKQDSVAKLSLTLGQHQSRYQTRREITKVLDYQSKNSKLSFDYLLSDYSYLATELSYQDIRFDINPLQNKEKLTGLIGFKWQTSAATRLSALVGYQKIAFEQAFFNDDSAFKWQLDWQWHPIDSTVLLLGSTRDFQEANRLNNSYRIVDEHHVSIKHSFNSFLNVSANFGLRQEQIIDSEHTLDEDYFIAQAQLNYQRNEWLSLYLRYSYDDLQANQPVLDYQSTGITIGFNVSI